MLRQYQIAWTSFDVSKAFIGEVILGETGVTETDSAPANPEKIMAGLEPSPIRTSALMRLRARGRQAIRRAEELRNQYGDPVDRLADLLSALPIDDDRWQEIIDEPYG